MEEVLYYKCRACGYEFLTKAKSPACPRCKGNDVEPKDLKNLAVFDE